MNRRGFFGWMGGFFAAGKAREPEPQPQRAAPWWGRADELFEKEGHYADFVAWQEWMSQQAERSPNGADWFHSMSLLEQIDLYGMFNDAR